MLPAKRLTAWLLAGVLGLSALTACAPAVLPAAAANPDTSRNTITVTGTGSAYGAPDVATVQIGVQSRNADPKAAMDENTTKMNALLDQFKSLGLEAKDLQTSNFSVSAQPDIDPANNQPKGTYTYVVDNTLTVTLRDTTKLGQALSQSVNAGANSIYGVSFSVSDPAKLEAQARDKAMADAKARAEALAKAAGVAVGEPISISEAINTPPLPMASFKADFSNASAPVPVASGQLQISLQVNVTYAIK